MIHRRSLTHRPCRMATLLGCLFLLSLSDLGWSAMSQSFDFKVYLGEDEIGHQRFDVSTEGDRTSIRIEAQFTVKFLYIPLYRYRHTNVETWEGACLQEIHAKTNDNGDSFFVNGVSQNGRMVVETHDGNWSGEGCFRTFAYWNLDWIMEGALLNSQTGEVQEATVRTVGQETISVQGAPTHTTHRRIITDKFTVDLWHTVNGRWVALQSTTAKGDVLRYTLQ